MSVRIFKPENIKDKVTFDTRERIINVTKIEIDMDINPRLEIQSSTVTRYAETFNGMHAQGIKNPLNEWDQGIIITDDDEDPIVLQGTQTVQALLESTGYSDVDVETLVIIGVSKNDLNMCRFIAAQTNSRHGAPLSTDEAVRSVMFFLSKFDFKIEAQEDQPDDDRPYLKQLGLTNKYLQYLLGVTNNQVNEARRRICTERGLTPRKNKTKADRIKEAVSKITDEVAIEWVNNKVTKVNMVSDADEWKPEYLKVIKECIVVGDEKLHSDEALLGRFIQAVEDNNKWWNDLADEEDDVDVDESQAHMDTEIYDYIDSIGLVDRSVELLKSEEGMKYLRTSEGFKFLDDLHALVEDEEPNDAIHDEIVGKLGEFEKEVDDDDPEEAVIESVFDGDPEGEAAGRVINNLKKEVKVISGKKDREKKDVDPPVETAADLVNKGLDAWNNRVSTVDDVNEAARLEGNVGTYLKAVRNAGKVLIGRSVVDYQEMTDLTEKFVKMLEESFTNKKQELLGK